MEIGAQFFTLREQCKTLDGLALALKQVADIGYRTVQISGTCPYEPAWLDEQLKKLDIALITMGSSEPEESASYLGGYITKEESNELIANGYAADICGHRLTRDGKPADTILSGRVLSIPLEDLKNVPTVIGMGAGKGKVQSMIAAAKGGYVTGLVMDEVAAITIVQQEKI